jgi:hypothetical protein
VGIDRTVSDTCVREKIAKPEVVYDPYAISLGQRSVDCHFLFPNRLTKWVATSTGATETGMIEEKKREVNIKSFCC